MAHRATPLLSLLIVLSGSCVAGATFAQGSQTLNGQSQEAQPQDTPAHTRARAATSSLNAGPAQTTMTPRPNAAPPLSDAERPPPVLERPGMEKPGLERAGQPRSSPSGPVPENTATADAATGEPEPIALPLGYYVRGDMNCNQVWPGEGNLAWLTPTSFTIDFGGCEPGQFLQTGPDAWHETQQCHTELGDDAGGYEVTYQVIGTGTLLRRAQLALDGRVEQDLWAHCETADVPVEARFKS
ncbi:hypothetical protein BH10PSE2_BH10PSE2_01690 [soil metagenome]